VAVVHQLLLADCSDAEVERARLLLDEDEAEKAARFMFDEHRRLYTLAHGMLRIVLGRSLQRAPEGLRFAIGEHGKPSIDGVEFNLSHTEGCIVVALGNDPLGVDVESWLRRTDVLGICDRFFAPSEAAALRALPPSEHRERFFRYWTLKEAYIKARGMGLAIPLASFSFDLSLERIAISYAPELDDDADRWHFAQTMTDTHMFAVCTSSRDAGLTLVPFRFVGSE